LIVDHQPHPVGGPAADTDFISSDSGQRVFQQVADDFAVGADATIRRVLWWGFYGGSFGGTTAPPVGLETMRIRFYEARPVDGLPGLVLYEESFLSPQRLPTGRDVFTTHRHPEYMYQVDLATPFDLNAGIPYWLEIVQVGDVASTFRWEFSATAPLNGFAFLNTGIPDWQTTTSSNCAFQLSEVPEPSTIASFGWLALLALTRPRKARELIDRRKKLLRGSLSSNTSWGEWRFGHVLQLRFQPEGIDSLDRNCGRHHHHPRVARPVSQPAPAAELQP
jgi:hypothetical protein